MDANTARPSFVVRVARRRATSAARTAPPTARQSEDGRAGVEPPPLSGSRGGRARSGRADQQRRPVLRAHPQVRWHNTLQDHPSSRAGLAEEAARSTRRRAAQALAAALAAQVGQVARDAEPVALASGHVRAPVQRAVPRPQPERPLRRAQPVGPLPERDRLPEAPEPPQLPAAHAVPRVRDRGRHAPRAVPLPLARDELAPRTTELVRVGRLGGKAVSLRRGHREAARARDGECGSARRGPSGRDAGGTGRAVRGGPQAVGAGEGLALLQHPHP